MTMINNKHFANLQSQDTNIIEIFSSIQGEGPCIGYRQIFIRFALCNLKCLYCDTQFKPKRICKIEECPGSGNFVEYENPVTIDQLIYKINEFLYFNHHSISLTGGEPLLCCDFLSYFLPELQKRKKNNNLKIYLETNGTLPDELRKVIKYLDIISMDLKIESSTGTPTPWEKHNDFADIALANNKDIFAKVVVTDKITLNEVEEIVEFLINRQIPLILQPVTSENKELIIGASKLLNIQESMLKKLNDVRIIPQTHKYLNLL